MQRRNDSDRGKTEGRLRLATPQDIKGVLFVNYYRRFVKDFIAVTDPLTSLTKKNVEW